MGNKISFPKSNLILHYYIFQKTIHKYLKDWKDKKDGEYIQKGYIFHPNWIKEWKRIIKYEDLKTNFIKHFDIESNNFNENQKLLITEHLEPAIVDYEINLIYYTKSDEFFPISNIFLSLENLENFCDEETYNLFKTNGEIEIETIEYIFKQKMLIIFCKTNIIKIVMFELNNNNNIDNNKLINLKYICNNTNKYVYLRTYFEKNNSKQIINMLSKKDIFNKKKYISQNKAKKILYTIIYEEESNNNKMIINSESIMTKTGDITNTPNKENEIKNNNNNSNSQLNTLMNETQSSFSLLNDKENNFEDNQNLTLNDKNSNLEKNISEPEPELGIKNAENENEQKTTDTLPEDDIIAIYLQSGDNTIKRPIACKKNNNFDKIEEKLYKDFPNIKENIDYFLVNGKQINRKLTLEQNKINDGDYIIICLKNFETETIE